VSPWFFAVAEREHDIQNPTSPEKIRLLGERMRLDARSQVLDVAAGRGGPALVLAREFGCTLTCVECAPVFATAARERIAAAGLDRLIEVVTADARDSEPEPGTYDAVMCLGASFIWGGLEGTLRALVPAVRPGGYVAVGEPYWRDWPLPDDVDDEGYVSLASTVTRFETCGAPVVSLIASSEDDWDRYETLHWRACEEWLAENPGHPEAAELATAYRDSKAHHLEVQRGLLGWAIFVGWLRPPA